MPKRPYSPAPDPNPMPVALRANLTRQMDNGPKVTLPVVRWLERDIDEKQPHAAPQFDAGESFEEEASPKRSLLPRRRKDGRSAPVERKLPGQILGDFCLYLSGETGSAAADSWHCRREVNEIEAAKSISSQRAPATSLGRTAPGRAEDENALETKFREMRRMNKTGKYVRESKITFTDDQFTWIKQAVKLSGKPFTEWARPLLLAAAEEQIRERRERELAAAE